MNRLLSWILMLGALGLVLAFFAYALYRDISGGAVLAFILCSFLIGGATSAACYALACRLSRYSDAVHVSVNLLVALIIGVALSAVVILVIFPAFDPDVRVPLAPYAAATTLLSLLITTVTTVVERRLGALSSVQEAMVQEAPKTLALREGVNRYIIPFDDIIYLSSADDSTVIHTESREYVAVRPMKIVLNSLPHDGFIRVHRSYAVNLRFVQRLEYVIGGQLLAHLNDTEATSVPVGRSHAPELKRRFGMKP